MGAAQRAILRDTRGRGLPNVLEDVEVEFLVWKGVVCNL